LRLLCDEGVTMQVSVVIPTYRRVEDLDKCLDSIVAQTKVPKEVLVIDNGRDDRTKDLVERRKREFERKRVALNYIRNDSENSLTVAKNIGVKCSLGDVISFLDDDLILDSNYYREITEVYKEMPKALGVEGYNYSVKKNEVRANLGSIFVRLFQAQTSFLEEKRCRVLPSLCVTYPRPSINEIISCEWLSGASTFRRSILQEIKADENLKKYAWNEDLDLSYRIFKKYPDSLFLTPNARYWHEESRKARLTEKDLIHMAAVYDLYLFYKNIDQNLKSKLIYLWSRIGRIALKVLLLILNRSESNPIEIEYMIKAHFYCMKHMKEIKKGDLRFFNETLE